MRRREFLQMIGALGVACKRSSTEGGVPDPGSIPIGRWPEKAADLVMLTDRPPNLEMPAKYLIHDMTPNEAMFVRWHLSGVPKEVDLETYRLKIAGHVERELSLSYAELKKLPQVSLACVNQCSGNGRSLFAPRVAGVQWANGAVGNAKWTGVRLKDLLERAGVKAGAVDVSFGGLDTAPLPSVPDFVKSLDVAHATDGDVMVAWAMNDAPLPMLNGFPLRLIVPGFYSTYWIKALDTITVLPSAFDGFWMAKAYRIPKNDFANEQPADLAKETVPIGKMVVRSLFARPLAGESVATGQPIAVSGVAFDGGSGIARVELSIDGGATWTDATLGIDHGKYSFRRWTSSWTPSAKGKTSLVVRATSVSGETQKPDVRWNRAGYMKNDPERIEVEVT